MNLVDQASHCEEFWMALLLLHFKRRKADHLASADLVWHRLVASIG